MDVALRPFFRRKYLLTPPEKHFYNVLRRVVGANKIMAKVRLADGREYAGLGSGGGQNVLASGSAS
jgi:hypothetical protein